MLELVNQRLAGLVQPQPHEVEKVAVEVGKLGHQIRLVAIAQIPHILFGEVGKLPVRQQLLRGAGLWKYEVSASWWIAGRASAFQSCAYTRR